jgi:hypothetical protein
VRRVCADARRRYAHTAPEHLIARLTARGLHQLAARMSAHLGLPADAVLRHWACAKIARAGADDDAAVCAAVVAKLNSAGGGSVRFAEVARRAWEAGRGGLASALLAHEPRAGARVPLLLAMRADADALRAAVDGGAPDLVYEVLLALHRRLPLGAFFRLLEDGGPALAPAARLLEVYARAQDRAMLRDFFFADDRREASAVLCLEDARRAEVGVPLGRTRSRG